MERAAKMAALMPQQPAVQPLSVRSFPRLAVRLEVLEPAHHLQETSVLLVETAVVAVTSLVSRFGAAAAVTEQAVPLVLVMGRAVRFLAVAAVLIPAVVLVAHLRLAAQEAMQE